MIHLGRHSYNYGVQRGTGNDVYVGNFSSIAEGVVFDGGMNHVTNNATTFPLHKIWSELPSNIEKPKDIYIGHNVWIGEGAIIMSGVKIGNGTIIGARAIVTYDTGENCTVVGAPMKIYSERINHGLHLKLEELNWYEWSDDKIRENAHLLLGRTTGIEMLINKHKP